MSFWAEPLFPLGSPAWLGMTFVVAVLAVLVVFWRKIQQFALKMSVLIGLSIFIGAGAALGGGVWLLMRGHPPEIEKTQSRALQYGVDVIYQEDSNLTFKEISARWEKSAPQDSYRGEDVLQWLVGDMWLGKFEDDDGNSVLRFIPSYIAIESAEDRTYLWQHAASLNRHRAFCFLARDSRLFDELFMGKHQELKQECEDWKAIKAIAPWSTLSKIEPTLYDDPNSGSPVRRDHFRRTVLEGAILSRHDFAKWLKNTKRKIPDTWLARVEANGAR